MSLLQCMILEDTTGKNSTPDLAWCSRGGAFWSVLVVGVVFCVVRGAAHTKKLKRLNTHFMILI